MSKTQVQNEESEEAPPSEPLAEASRWRLRRSLALVGLMGAGKTAIGKRLALAAEVPFLDADAEIEAAARMTIPEIFALHGEPAFRDGERRVIARLAETPAPFVLATGGGAFMDPNTRKLLKERCVVLWLKADVDVLVRRLAKKSDRPLLESGDRRATLAALIERRHPVYAEAHLTLDGGEATQEEALLHALALLAREGLAEKRDPAERGPQ
ncbi:shikimate kinase [Neomegalonema perideroedes]|uniref:shikimate kinase n=1 Tax=Neomegalonema perideroedes TaxID=217219 RepID=UPI00037646FA|nr:shikimate kinase [Neomegalonema perideroedes]